MKEEKNYILGDETSSKLLSIVVTGRNDNYLGNFNYRISTCLNYLAHNLKDIGYLDGVEVMVTDWNSEVPLSKTLALSPEAARICRFLYVPPSIAVTRQQPGRNFNAPCAANASLRRAQGKFLMWMGADILFPRFSLQAFLELLDGKLSVPFGLDRCFFFCGRQFTSWEMVQRRASLEEWDRYLLLNSGQSPHEQSYYGLGTGSAAQLMHRSIWHSCRGYDEELSYWGWSDAELTLRVTQHYPWVELSSFGVSTFEMESWPNNQRKCQTPLNPTKVNFAFAVNDVNWGLGNYELDIQSAEKTLEPLKETGFGKAFSHLPGSRKTRSELIAELSSQSVREYVERIIPRKRINVAEWESLCAMAWFSRNYYPRSFLEFGFRDASDAVVVAAFCPGVEIYRLDPFQSTDSRFIPSPSQVDRVLERYGYRGYTRFITGEPSTAFRRLRDSSIGRLSLDLVLFHAGILGVDVLQQLNDLIPHLSPGGMIVFTHNSTADFQCLWREMQKKFNRFTYLQCKSGKTGLILDISLQNDTLSKPLDVAEDFLLDFGNPPPANILARQMRRIYRALRNPARYPEYAKRMFRLFCNK